MDTMCVVNVSCCRRQTNNSDEYHNEIPVTLGLGLVAVFRAPLL